MSIEELSKEWRKRATIENDIAGVYDKHEDWANAGFHMSIARTWRQAAYELEQSEKHEKGEV